MHHTSALKKNHQFQQVYKKGKSASDRHLVVFIMENGLGSNRLGVSAGKKIGNAVVRNRQRRRVKEAYRAIKPIIGAGFDIVIRPRDPKTQFTEFVKSLNKLLVRLG